MQTTTIYTEHPTRSGGVYRLKVEQHDTDNLALASDSIHAPYRDVLSLTRIYDSGSYIGRITRESVRRYRRAGKQGDMAVIRTGGMMTARVLDALYGLHG